MPSIDHCVPARRFIVSSSSSCLSPLSAGGPRLRVLAHPAVVDEPDRDGVEEVQLLAAPPARRDAALPPRARSGASSRRSASSAAAPRARSASARPAEQLVEQARRVGSASALNTSSMGGTIGDSLVTCQASGCERRPGRAGPGPGCRTSRRRRLGRGGEFRNPSAHSPVTIRVSVLRIRRTRQPPPRKRDEFWVHTTHFLSRLNVDRHALRKAAEGPRRPRGGVRRRAARTARHPRRSRTRAPPTARSQQRPRHRTRSPPPQPTGDGSRYPQRHERSAAAAQRAPLTAPPTAAPASPQTPRTPRAHRPTLSPGR